MVATRPVVAWPRVLGLSQDQSARLGWGGSCSTRWLRGPFSSGRKEKLRPWPEKSPGAKTRRHAGKMKTCGTGPAGPRNSRARWFSAKRASSENTLLSRKPSLSTNYVTLKRVPYIFNQVGFFEHPREMPFYLPGGSSLTL